MLLGKWDAVISFRVYEENVVFYEENNFVYVAKCNIKRCGACERISIPRLRDKSVNYFHGTQTYFKAVARTCMFRKTHLLLKKSKNFYFNFQISFLKSSPNRKKKRKKNRIKFSIKTKRNIPQIGETFEYPLESVPSL